MPSERAIVETLNRKELLELVSYFDLDVADRRVRDHLVDAIAMAPGLTLAEVLEQLPMATLKSVCSKHGLQVQGRGKAAYVASIAQVAAPKAAPKGRAASRIKAVSAPKPAAKAGAAAKATKAKTATSKAKVAKVAKAAKVSKVAKAAKTPKVAAVSKAAKVARKSKAAGKSAAAKVAPKAKPTPKAKAAKVKAVDAKAAKAKATKAKSAPRAKAAKVTIVTTEIVDLAQAEHGTPDAAQSKRPRAAKAAKSVRAKAGSAHKISAATKQTEAEVLKLGSRAQPPAVKKAKAVALPLPDEASASPMPPLPPPSNVIPLPYVNTPAAMAAAEAAAVHLRATADPSIWAPTTRTQKCASCATKLELRKCTAQKCNNMLVASPTRKICAECMFERNTLSMDDFNARLEEEANCPHCGKVWQKST